jgi:hypothetical protein
MTLDEKRWQKKLARKRKAQASRRPPPQRSNLLSPAQAAHRPIHDAIIAADLFANGIGLVGLARALPDGDVALSAFLVDVYCLGVKNAFYRVVSPEEWGQFVEGMELEKIHPSCLRKLVEGAVAYARDLGFPPHADYARAATLFGSIEAAVCPVRYTYGQNGKPFYVSGPDETPAQVRRILNTLTRRLGADGFHFCFCLFASFTLAKMIRDNRDEQIDTSAWVITVWVGFALAVTLTAWGLFRMAIGDWEKGYMVVAWLFLINTVFSVAKLVRDKQEADLIEGVADSGQRSLTDGTAEN